MVDEGAVPDSFRLYRLEAGTDAEDAPSVIRPDDYAESTNEKVWKIYALAGETVGAAIGAADSADGEIALFDGTSGKQLKRATGSGLAKLTSGVLSAATAGTDYVEPGSITASALTMATSRLLGRTTASTGAVEEITVGSGLTYSAGTLAAVASTGIAPAGIVSVSGNIELTQANHGNKFLELDGSHELTLLSQAGGGWAAGTVIWILNRSVGSDAVIIRSSGVVLRSLLNNDSDLLVAPSGGLCQIWRQSENVWRIIAGAAAEDV
jgi:hypothetical protein